jgi:hypothetical protein
MVKLSIEKIVKRKKGFEVVKYDSPSGSYYTVRKIKKFQSFRSPEEIEVVTPLMKPVSTSVFLDRKEAEFALRKAINFQKKLKKVV